MTDPVPFRQNSSASVHLPVLVREVIQWLDLRNDSIVVDATYGGGGHAAQILQSLGPAGRLLGLDRDPAAITRRTEASLDPRCRLFCLSYTRLPEALHTLGLTTCDRVLVDLGLSSDQLADPQRGFGFHSTAPLDMRFNPHEGRPAYELLATLSQAELTTLFETCGEEPHAASIARQIVERRRHAGPMTASELCDLVTRSVPPSRMSGTHPATRVFQALRIAVNRELDELERLLNEVLPSCLAPGGRAVIIAFHSLEDRLVKQAFRNRGIWEDLTKKPVQAGPREKRLNPRSRSAKLRAAVRI